MIETGIYNLTKDEAPTLVHFGKDKTEQWLLVRVKQDDQDPGSATRTVAARHEAEETPASSSRFSNIQPQRTRSDTEIPTTQRRSPPA